MHALAQLVVYSIVGGSRPYMSAALQRELLIAATAESATQSYVYARTLQVLEQSFCFVSRCQALVTWRRTHTGEVQAAHTHAGAANGVSAGQLRRKLCALRSSPMLTLTSSTDACVLCVCRCPCACVMRRLKAAARSHTHAIQRRGC